MIVVLDVSAAVAVATGRCDSENLIKILGEADWVISPELYIAEAANVFWKYHAFENLPIRICEERLEAVISMVDDFFPTKELVKESLAFSCRVNHPVYDSLYMILARRENALLLTQDKRLIAAARKNSIQVYESPD